MLAVVLAPGCRADTSAIGCRWLLAVAAPGATLVCCLALAAEGDKHAAICPLRGLLYGLSGLWASSESGFAADLFRSLSAASSPASTMHYWYCALWTM